MVSSLLLHPFCPLFLLCSLISLCFLQIRIGALLLQQTLYSPRRTATLSPSSLGLCRSRRHEHTPLLGPAPSSLVTPFLLLLLPLLLHSPAHLFSLLSHSFLPPVIFPVIFAQQCNFAYCPALPSSSRSPFTFSSVCICSPLRGLKSKYHRTYRNGEPN